MTTKYTTNDGGTIVIYRKETEFSVEDVASLKYLCEENPDILNGELLVDEDKPLGLCYPKIGVKESWILSAVFDRYPTKLATFKGRLPVRVAEELVFADKSLSKKSNQKDFRVYSHKIRNMYCIVFNDESNNKDNDYIICCFGQDAVPLLELEQESIRIYKKEALRKLEEINAQVNASIKRFRKDEYIITQKEAELPYVGYIP